MLSQYITQTARLLQNPGAPQPLYATPDLTSYVNMARNQIAIEGECVRVFATLITVPFQNTYAFSSINTSGSPAAQGPVNVRLINGPVTNSISAIVGTGLLNSWPWEYFNFYFNCRTPPPAAGTPTDWAQYGQGAGGSFAVYPPPDNSYTLALDTVCYPIPLVDDTTAEAIPYPWTDCVPFFAAFYALLSAQSPTRQADADRMFNRYQEFKDRARRFSNPSVESYIYPQSGPPIRLTPIDAGASAQKGGA